MPFHLICVHIMLSSVWVVEWPSFGKELLIRLTIFSLCVFFPRFGFEGWILGSVTSVHFYFCDLNLKFPLILAILVLNTSSSLNDMHS